ncbi:HIG1 domain family member 2A, mitochondrial [Latimeria chalumnae]|nr:PREDICTED: HIG1 domain family member 2A, mitochondrial [Latimeria chalumnae]|eukprot:XP_005993437.1 PREDICTED: HIG1 domain family member 2A, mitochondrial [Latimeria chalumnae]
MTATPVEQSQAPEFRSMPVSGAFDASRPPIIAGFTPTARLKEEDFKDKFMRKVNENPLVPLGCLCTAGVLTYGLIAFKQGKTRQSQLLMRARILAQGFTVGAILIGVVATAMKPRH